MKIQNNLLSAVLSVKGCPFYSLIMMILFSFSIIIMPSPSLAVEYSLDDLFQLALAHAERLKITEEDIGIAGYNKDKAMSVLFPKVYTFGGYTRFNDNKRTSTGLVIQPDESISWGIRFDQSLSLSGREIIAIDISRLGMERSRYNLLATKEEYLLTVATSYYELLKAKRAVEISKANLQRLTKHRDAATVRLRAGEITKTDLLRAEAGLSGARAEQVRAKNDLRLAKAILARVVGISGDFDISEGKIEDNSLLDLSLDSLKQIAFSERAEIKAAEIQTRIAEDQIRYTKGAYWPSILIQGIYSRKEENPATVFLNRESLYGGITLNFPLFEGGLRKAEVREMDSRLIQAQLSLEDIKKTIGIEVEKAYLDLMTQKEILKSLEDQLSHAKDNYKTVSRQYELGIANSIDVIDANTLYLTAEKQLSEAMYDYEIALCKLKRATGVLLKSVERQRKDLFYGRK